MHITRRIVIVLALGLALLPISVALQAMLAQGDRQEVVDAFHVALREAAGEYGASAGLARREEHARSIVDTIGPRVVWIDARKRTLRHRARGLLGIMRKVGLRYGVDFTDLDAARLRVDIEKRTFTSLIRDTYVVGAPVIEGVVQSVRQALHGSPMRIAPAYVVADVRDQRMRQIDEMTSALRAAEELGPLRVEYAQILAEEQRIRPAVEQARQTLALAERQAQQIQEILQDVHQQVLDLQSELARMDARLKRKAERALLDRGLLAPKQPGETSDQISAKPAFSWPAYGPVSAGFRDSAYYQYFGLPHDGMDIVVPQSSPVYSAADGVVFVVRDGGESGYTYVLIGHRGGYATLYGHLLGVSVTPGQEVSAGEQIGVSGGRPGTHGAGPLTTAPHLHFEVIHGGVNIDPKMVLP